jgi:hypothetical protein
MVNLIQLRHLFTPGMYAWASHFRERTGLDIEWDIWDAQNPDGIGLSATCQGVTRKAIISEAELDKAQEQETPWRYRLVGGPTAWRKHSLLKRRNEQAIVQIFKARMDHVFFNYEAPHDRHQQAGR